MNLSQLRYFTETVRTGSYSGAAQRLDVTRQAVSRYVDGIERALGRPLLAKENGTLVPTKDGEAYLRTAREINDVMLRMRTSISNLSDKAAHILSFGVTLRHGSIMLNECIAELLSRYPSTQPRIAAGLSYELVSRVQNGEIDAAMISDAALSPDSPVEHFAICECEVFLCVPEYHALAHNLRGYENLPVVDIEELRDEVFILSPKSGSLSNPNHYIFRNASYSPTVGAWAELSDTVLLLTQKGFGISFLPYYDCPGVCWLRLRHPFSSGLSIIFRKGHVFSGPERYLIWLLKNRMLSGGMSFPAINDAVTALDNEYTCL